MLGAFTQQTPDGGVRRWGALGGWRGVGTSTCSPSLTRAAAELPRALTWQLKAVLKAAWTGVWPHSLLAVDALSSGVSRIFDRRRKASRHLFLVLCSYSTVLQTFSFGTMVSTSFVFIQWGWIANFRHKFYQICAGSKNIRNPRAS